MVYSMMTINLSGGWFWYTYAKSIGNTVLATIGLKSVSRFKATAKMGTLQSTTVPGARVTMQGQRTGFVGVELRNLYLR